MEIRKSKSGIVFSILALFIATLIVGFGLYSLELDEFNKEEGFKETRIASLDAEIIYFKEIHMKEILEFSLNRVFYEILENKTLLNLVDKDHERLNALVYEGIFNSSLDGDYSTDLEDYTFNVFYSKFQDDFNRNFKGDFNVNVTELNIYEETPYYVTIHFYAVYNVTTLDNISTWNFEDDFKVSIPVYELKEPAIFLHSDYNVTVRPYQLYATQYFNQWSYDAFNEAVNESLSNVFEDEEYKYTLGVSFLNRMLNQSPSSYYGVEGFWSFDYDSQFHGVYDTSLINGLGKHFGNTVFLANFDENLSDIGVVEDLTAYSNNGSTNFGVNFSSENCIFGSCLEFGGDNEYVRIDKDTMNLNFTNQFSIATWVYPRDYTDSVSGKASEIFRYGANQNDVISLRLTSDRKVLFEVGVHDGGRYYRFNSTHNVSLNKWTFVVATFDGNNGVARIYVDGRLSNLDEFGNLQSSQAIVKFDKSAIDIGLGDLLSSYDESFNGKLDEFGVYSRILSDDDVADIFRSRTVRYIDYVDSLHGTGILFDGRDDYIEIIGSSDKYQYGGNNFSTCVWFKMLDKFPNSGDDYQQLFTKKANGGIILGNFEMEINNSGAKVSFLMNDSKNQSSSFLRDDLWYYACTVVEGNRAFFYLNGAFESTIYSIGNVSSTDFNLFIGADPIAEQYFKGIIDEVKIYNRSLSSFEVSQNYLNYGSNAKGCCNYMTLIDSNEFGHNLSSQRFDVGYSTKRFYEVLDSNKWSNTTLMYIENITSNNTDEEYYNFLVDPCIERAFDIASWTYNLNYSLEFVNRVNSSHSCTHLINQGVY